MPDGWLDSADTLTRLRDIVDGLAAIVSAVDALVADVSDCESIRQALSDARGRLVTAEQEMDTHAAAFRRAAEEIDDRGRI